MAKLILKLAAILVVVLLGYNYFFGTEAEKETSRRVVAQVGELTSSVFDLLKSEKEKFDQGKYDAAFTKLKTAIGIEKKRATELGTAGRRCLEDCEHLEQQEMAIEAQFASLTQDTSLTEEEKSAAFRAIRDQIIKLTNQTDAIASELDQ